MLVVSVVFVGGGGVAKPPEGISPAKAETESTHVKAIAAKNRFMDSPLSCDATNVASERIKQLSKVLARYWMGY